MRGAQLNSPEVLMPPPSQRELMFDPYQWWIKDKEIILATLKNSLALEGLDALNEDQLG